MRRLSVSLGLMALLLLTAWLLSKSERASPPRSTPPEEVSVPRPQRELAPPVVERVEPGREPSPSASEEGPAALSDTDTSDELLWFGRVVDAETLAPFAQAGVAVMEGDPSSAPDDLPWTAVPADGLVELRDLHLQSSVILVAAPGCSTAFVVPQTGHEEPAHAQVVELRRTASIVLRLRDERPLPGEPRVQILVDDWKLFAGNSFRSFGGKFAWEAVPEVDGRLSFDELTPRVELTLTVVEEERTLLTETLRLQPGERRELDLALHDGGTIIGRAVTSEGAPVADLEIWLVKHPRLLGAYFDDVEETQARVRTDAQGAFAFEGVAPATWFVGPAAGGTVAPASVQVELEPGEGSARVTLTCWSGLTIRGRVLDSQGNPVRSASVTALAHGVLCSAQTEADGTFAAGPLAPGDYSVFADQLLEGHDGRSDEVRAHAGDVDVLLRLRLGATLVATVLDELGGPAAHAHAELISASDAYEGQGTYQSDEQGRIEFTGIPSGRCALIVRHGAMIAVLANLAVEAGTTSEGHELRLEPGAKVAVLRPARHDAVACRIRQAGWEIWKCGFGGEGVPEVVVPPGELEIELLGPGPDGALAVLESKTVQARASELERVEFEPTASAPR